MEEKSRKISELNSRVRKIQLIAAPFGIALGLGMQYIVNPNKVFPPFMQNATVSYAAVGIGALGTLVAIVLVVGAILERGKLLSE